MTFEPDTAFLFETAALRSTDLSERERQGLRMLGELYQDRPPVRASWALAVMWDLMDELARVVLAAPHPSGEVDPVARDLRSVRALERIARQAQDAADMVRARLEGGPEPRLWDRWPEWPDESRAVPKAGWLLTRLERLADRLEATEGSADGA